MVFKEHQKNIQNRIIKQCKQHGIVMVHSMGSGKTRSALGLIFNMPENLKIIIVTPPGIEVSWKDEIEQINKNIFVGRVVKYFNYDNLSENLNEFENAIVFFDEAHKLIPILNLKQGRNLNTFFSLLKKAYFVGLMTGTPMINNYDEMMILVNLAAGQTIVPSQMHNLIDAFPLKLTEEQKSVSNSFLKLNTAQRARFFNVTQSRYSALGGVVAGAAAAAAATTGFLAAPVVLAGMVPIMWGTKRFTQAANGFLGLAASTSMQYTELKNQLKSSTPLDIEKLGNAINPYISYYSIKENNVSVPIKEIEKNIMRFSDYQINLYVKASSNLLSEVEKNMLNMKTNELGRVNGGGISKTMQFSDFASKMNVISNLSEDNIYFTTKQQTNGTYNVEQKTNINNTLYDETYKHFKKVNNIPVGLFQGNGKFLDAVQRIRASREKNPYLPVVYSNYDEYGMQLFSAYLNQYGLHHIVLIPNTKNYGSYKELAVLPHRLWQNNDDVNKQKVTVGYVNGENALWTTPFGIALDKTANTDRMRKTFLDPESDNFLKRMNGDVAGDNRNNFCVLIHPSITEGLSFSLSPMLLCLEVPYGFGKQEQIYARVIRTIGTNEPYKADSMKVTRSIYNHFAGGTKNGRYKKKIIQYVGSFKPADEVALPKWFRSTLTILPRLPTIIGLKLPIFKAMSNAAENAVDFRFSFKIPMDRIFIQWGTESDIYGIEPNMRFGLWYPALSLDVFQRSIGTRSQLSRIITNPTRLPWPFEDVYEVYEKKTKGGLVLSRGDWMKEFVIPNPEDKTMDNILQITSEENTLQFNQALKQSYEEFSKTFSVNKIVCGEISNTRHTSEGNFNTNSNTLWSSPENRGTVRTKINGYSVKNSDVAAQPPSAGILGGNATTRRQTRAQTAQIRLQQLNNEFRGIIQRYQKARKTYEENPEKTGKDAEEKKAELKEAVNSAKRNIQAKLNKNFPNVNVNASLMESLYKMPINNQSGANAENASPEMMNENAFQQMEARLRELDSEIAKLVKNGVNENINEKLKELTSQLETITIMASQQGATERVRNQVRQNIQRKIQEKNNFEKKKQNKPKLNALRKERNNLQRSINNAKSRTMRQPENSNSDGYETAEEGVNEA